MTDSQQIVFDFIVSYKRKHDGVAPSLAEICDACGLKAKSHVSVILQQLHSCDLIRFKPGVSRSVQVIGGRWIYEPMG
jgi:SOS-response transcriptional repressor LexA